MMFLTDGRERRDRPYILNTDEYEVVRKFFPDPTDREQESFLAVLLSWKGDTVTCWMPCELFGSANIGDIVTLPHADPEEYSGQWSMEDYQIRHVYYPLKHIIEPLRYVSAPVQIGREAYYVCRLSLHWIIIPYSVAQTYFDQSVFHVDHVDHYQVLGICRGAGAEEIRLAYRSRARRYHPDRAPKGREREYANQMCVLNDAYGVLSDAQRRRIYDEQAHGLGTLKRWPNNGPGTLEAWAETRGNWWLVQHITRFQAKSRKREFTVPIQSIVFTRDGFHVPIKWPVSPGKDVESWIQCTWDNYDLCPEVNDIKEEIGGEIILTLTEVESAEWGEERSEPRYHWKTKGMDVYWPEGALDQLRARVENYMAAVP